MKNKNNVVLTIIAIATILVTVIGATFAYFASTVDEGTGSNFTAVVEEDNVLFTATGSNMTMEVTADKMTEHASSSGTIVAATADADVMNVTLTTGTEEEIACYYNIYFQWDAAGTAYLTKTAGANKEFTAYLAMIDTDGTGYQGSNLLASETQLTDVITTTNKTLVVSQAKIVASASNGGSQTWSPTIKFYNLQLDQTALAGKTFKGKFTIDDVECGSNNSLTLSESILALASNEDYTSSQDSSIYKVARENVSYNSVAYDAGVRYEGLDPDNYLTFNGESAGWRIIGVFEGSTIGLEPGKYYTKIIRNTRIGTYAWDSDYENDWTNSTLNTYLNGTYLSGLTNSNKIAKYNGNYSTWYLRGTSNHINLYSQDWYVTERVSGQAGYRNGTQYAADTETTGAIGIMYPSDYGYAAYGSSCDNNITSKLSNYGTKDWDTMEVSGCATVNYLATDSLNNADYEWLISPYPNLSGYAFLVFGLGGGYVSDNYVYAEIAVRPVLYLEASETLSGGSGTKLDPYVLTN